MHFLTNVKKTQQVTKKVIRNSCIFRFENTVITEIIQKN